MLREAASLLVGGLRTRARLAASGSVGRLWHSGLHLGALWRIGLVLTALTAAVALSPAANIDPSGHSWGTAARYLLPVAIVGLLAWQRPPPQPRSWLWLLVPILVAVDATASGYVINDTGGRVTWLLLPALLVGALALVPVDPRLAIGATVLLAPQLARIILDAPPAWPPIAVLLWAGGTLTFLLAAIWGTRQLARA